MRILMVCAELAPWAKTGGLADAVAGLSDALAARGHDVRVVLPRYAHLAAREHLTVAGPGGPYSLGEAEPEQKIEHAGSRKPRPRVFLVDLAERAYDRIYTGDDRDGPRFLRLSAAAAALAATDAWRPHVVHCHDWHAALTPLLQRATATATPSVLTLHNVGYQGVFPTRVLAEAGLADLESRLPADTRAAGTVNFLRTGILTADRITTVSPTYAAEIRRPEFGMGLEDVVTARGDDVSGILNGVDYGVWSPERDPYLAEHYTAVDLLPKLRLKLRLLARLGLGADAAAPLIGVVSRLATQKGVDLIAAAIPTLLAETPARLALLGNGDPAIATELRRLAAQAPDRVAFEDAQDERLAHEIFAASDLTLVPSRYEPCGLTQMYALRYGTIPVVRATGGLADTVQHFDPLTGLGNGSVFRDADSGGLLWAIRTALAWFRDEHAWRRLVANAMASDFSWGKQVPLYEELYRSLL
jgi:starch synthase